MKRNSMGWNWVIFYWVISGYLVLNTILMRYLPDFSQKYRLMGPFDLSVEMNLAVWWSGMGLFLAGLIFYQLYSLKKTGGRIAWLLLAGIAATLAIDELGSLHERVGIYWGKPYLLPFGVILFAMLAAAFMRLRQEPGPRASLFPLGLSFILFGSVVVQEKLEHAIHWPLWSEGLRAGIEEGVELAAVFLLLYEGVRRLRDFRAVHGIRTLFPDPVRLRHPHLLLWAGFILHMAACFFLQPYIQDHRGDPTAVYPAFGFFFLFALTAGTDFHPEGPGWLWKLTAASFIVCSAGQIYEFSKLIPYLSRVVDKEAFLNVDVEILILTAVAMAAFRKPAGGLPAMYKALLAGYCAMIMIWDSGTILGAPSAPIKIGFFVVLLSTALMEGAAHSAEIEATTQIA